MVDVAVQKKEIGRPKKDKSSIKDLQSTGRKRAAELWPITDGMACEWKGLLNAGGGIEPIIGCIGNPATDRHHGPDKMSTESAQHVTIDGIPVTTNIILVTDQLEINLGPHKVIIESTIEKLGPLKTRY